MTEAKRTRQDAATKQITGLWVVGIVVVGTLLALVAGINARPVTRVLKQIRFLEGGLQLPPNAREQVRLLAGPRAVRHDAVSGAVSLVRRRAKKEPLPQNHRSLYDRLLAADPDNAAVVYMLAAVEGSGDQPAAVRAKAASELLKKANDRPVTTWYVGDRRAIWATVLRQEGLGDVEAGIFSEQIVGYQWADAFRTTGKTFLRLADELVQSGDEAGAETFCGHVIVMARAVVREDPDPTLALSAAELLASAYQRRSLLASVRDRTERQADLAGARVAVKFENAYVRAVERSPHNALDPSGRRVTRPTAYRQMMSALLSTGVWAAMTGTTAVLLVVFGPVYVLARRRKSDALPPLRVTSRFWWLCGVVMAVTLPAVVLTASARAVPMREVYWASGDWVGSLLGGTMGWTVWSLAVASGLWTGRHLEAATPARLVWRWTALALFVFGILTVLPQWRWFGRHTSWYDQSFQLSWAVVRFRQLCALPWVFGMIGGLVQSVVFVVSRLRRGKTVVSRDGESIALENSQRRLLGLRSMLLVCCVGFSAGATGLVLAERGFYRYDARFRRLFLADMKDEISARLGPAWKEKYFPGALQARGKL